MSCIDAICTAPQAGRCLLVTASSAERKVSLIPSSLVAVLSIHATQKFTLGLSNTEVINMSCFFDILLLQPGEASTSRIIKNPGSIVFTRLTPYNFALKPRWKEYLLFNFLLG